MYSRHRVRGQSPEALHPQTRLSRTQFIKGVRQIKTTKLDPLYVFISPPSLASLKSRLRGRGTETDESVAKRLATALKEVAYAKQPGVHDLVIVNDDVDRAYALLEKIALGEENVTADALPPLDDDINDTEPQP
jgi:guanylate kinase